MLEASADGVSWRELECRYKVGDVLANPNPHPHANPYPNPNPNRNTLTLTLTPYP